MTGLSQVCAELGARIDARRGEAIELLVELVRTRSVNPSYPGVDRAAELGGETRVNEILCERYEQAGLATSWVAPDPDRRALVGVRSGAGGGRSLILNGHIDTVPPAEGGAWTRGSPWDPVIEGDLLYGLGATDMKASGVSMWLVAQALRDAGVELLGDLQLHSVPGEETGEHFLGTTACVEAGFRADAAIVTEPTNPPRPLTIALVSAPFLWLKLTVEGKATHAGNRPLAIRPGGLGNAIGVNALEKGVKIVQALQELERQWGVTKTHPYFSPGFFNMMPGIFRADPGVPFPAYFPDRAEIHWIIWYPPQQTDEEARQELVDYILGVCSLDPWLAEHPPTFEWPLVYPPMETPWEHELPQAMASAWQRVTGSPAPPPSPATPAMFGAAMEGSWLQQLGIPSIAFGPGDLRVAHARDEHVSLDEMILAAKCLAACVVEWCGTA